MTAEEFLRGHPIADGCRFGPEPGTSPTTTLADFG
jgi:hypothetical protein